MNFFDNMYDTIPYSYRLVSKDYKEDEKPHTVAKKQRIKGKPMSMVELKERAQQKIENIQQKNRDKSQAKILQLTEEHKKSGKGPKMSKADKAMFEDLDQADSDGDEPKKMFKNKGKVDESKLANKRKQKEAKKATKINKQKGIIDLERDGEAGIKMEEDE